ncbi:MAG: ester cyclase [Actinomycetota bacterium]
MGVDENVATISRLEEAYEALDWDTVREILAPDFQNGGPMGDQLPGAEAVIAGATQAATEYFPDKKQVVLDLFGEDDKVVSRVRLTGSNSGKGIDWAQIPPNGNQVDVEWITIYRLDGGQVLQTWGQMDVAKMMMQLGAMEGGN